MVKFGQFHSASDSKIDICSITLQIRERPVQFKYFWKYLTRLVEAADICRCARRGQQLPRWPARHITPTLFATNHFFLTFYKIHKPLLGRTDTTSKSQEIEFSGVEFVEFNQVVKYLSGGGGGPQFANIIKFCHITSHLSR